MILHINVFHMIVKHGWLKQWPSFSVQTFNSNYVYNAEIHAYNTLVSFTVIKVNHFSLYYKEKNKKTKEKNTKVSEWQSLQITQCNGLTN